jgi:hypothetical protein
MRAQPAAAFGIPFAPLGRPLAPEESPLTTSEVTAGGRGAPSVGPMLSTRGELPPPGTARACQSSFATPLSSDPLSVLGRPGSDVAWATALLSEQRAEPESSTNRLRPRDEHTWITPVYYSDRKFLQPLQSVLAVPDVHRPRSYCAECGKRGAPVLEGRLVARFHQADCRIAAPRAVARAEQQKKVTALRAGPALCMCSLGFRWRASLPFDAFRAISVSLFWPHRRRRLSVPRATVVRLQALPTPPDGGCSALATRPRSRSALALSPTLEPSPQRERAHLEIVRRALQRAH